jgi:hypothetical protein
VKTFSATSAGGLRLKREIGTTIAIPDDDLDLAFVQLVETTLRRRIPAAGIVVPVAGTTAALAAGVTAALRLIARARNVEGTVVIVTSRPGLRSQLDRLLLGNLPLVETMPRAVISPLGDARAVGRRRNDVSGWVAFTSDLDRAVALRSDVVVVDGDGHRVDSSALRDAAGRCPLIYTSASALDPVLSVVSEFGVVIGFDRGQIASTATGGSSFVVPPWTGTAAAGGTHETLGPEATRLDVTLAALWRSLARAQHAGGAAHDLAWAWGVAGALGMLAVPVGDHDRAARVDPWSQILEGSAERALTIAKNNRSRSKDLLEQVADAIEDAVDAALTTNPKPAALAAIVAEETAAGRRFVIGARSRAAAVATGLHLDELPSVPLAWRDLGRVTTARRILLDGPGDETCTTIITGPPGSLYAGLTVIPPGGRLVVLTAGAWESSRVRRQIVEASAAVTDTARGAAAITAASRLGVTIFDSAVIEPMVTGREPMPAAHRKSVPGSPWDPFDVRVVGDLGRREPDTEDRQACDTDLATDVITVYTDSGVVLLPPQQLVSRVRDGEEREVAAKALRAGDMLVLVDAEARADLFELVAARAQELPELAAVVALVDDWHVRAARGPETARLSYDQILSAMTGTSITTAATVGSWVRGDVHGPDDPDDITRFAIAVGDPTLVRRAEATARAIETLRRYRRRLGMMLASAASLEEHDGWLDARLGIHFHDLATMLTTHLVTRVDPTVTKVRCSVTGRLLPDDRRIIDEEMP